MGNRNHWHRLLSYINLTDKVTWQRSFLAQHKWFGPDNPIHIAKFEIWSIKMLKWIKSNKAISEHIDWQLSFLRSKKSNFGQIPQSWKESSNQIKHGSVCVNYLDRTQYYLIKVRSNWFRSESPVSLHRLIIIVCVRCFEPHCVFTNRYSRIMYRFQCSCNDG